MAPPSHDVERGSISKMKEESLAPGSSFSMREPDYGDVSSPHYLGRFVDSFRRDQRSSLFATDPLGQDGGADRVHDGAHYYDLQSAMLETANSGLSRELKGRHLQMIAIGGSIGTGLFVASGRALADGGPASILLAFTIVGTMLFCTCQALGELAVMFPIAGSFSSWATRFIDPSWGFAMGWNYAMQWLIVLPLEIIAASLTLSYWDESLTRAIFVSVFLFVIIIINMCGVKGYGEADLLGIVLNCGGTPDSGYIGGRYWHNPGAFNNGFKGMCNVFVTAAFSFAGTELIGLAAAETANPRKSLPTALKQVFWRITLFYIVSLTLVGLLVPYDDPRLVGGDSDADAKASPFVIAIEEAGIQVLPSVMNAVILISVLSVGNSAVFGSSRTLAALANLRQAPKILGYVDRKGRPLVSIGIASAFGLISFLADLPEQGAVLDWLMAISGLSTIITWGSICVCHIRFRRAWAARGRSVSELPFQSQVGVVGSYIGITLNLLVIAAQFWVGAFPIGWKDFTTAAVARNFFHKWVGAPCVLIFYLVHKLYFRTTFVRTHDMDVDTGRRDFNVPILVAQEQEERQSWPRWKRYYKFMC
ncbi:hypothetical protein F66182_6131 [Fusarium sp. NRRL 66182]|nr:hypothetical protein F66182_6131 [Fusarium sp. NRRL 66182]